MKAWRSLCVAAAALAVVSCNRSQTAQDAANTPAQDPMAAYQPNAAPSPAPGGYTPVQSTGVVINGYQLTAQDMAQMGGSIPPGNYWYDGMAGFWGYVGGPVQGQVTPGLRIGTLRPDASAGNTRVFINGRELTMVEVAWLSRLGPVRQGRFWMNPQGVFGYEGGGALGQIQLGAQGGGGGGRPSLSERGMLFRPGEILMGD